MECMDRITFGRFSLFLPHRPPYLLHLDGIYKQNRIACVCKWQAQHIHIEVFIQPFLCSSCLHLFHSYRFVHHTEFAVFSCALFRINKRILGAGLFGFRIRAIRPKKAYIFIEFCYAAYTNGNCLLVSISKRYNTVRFVTLANQLAYKRFVPFLQIFQFFRCLCFSSSCICVYVVYYTGVSYKNIRLKKKV